VFIYGMGYDEHEVGPFVKAKVGHRRIAHALLTFCVILFGRFM
jgi:hypothetical protein